LLERILHALLQHDLPLINNEAPPQGESSRRTKCESDREMLACASFSPREFNQSKINEAEEVEAFFTRFQEEATRFLEDRTDNAREVISWVYGYYRLILLEETAEQSRSCPSATMLVPARRPCDPLRSREWTA